MPSTGEGSGPSGDASARGRAVPEERRGLRAAGRTAAGRWAHTVTAPVPGPLPPRWSCAAARPSRGPSLPLQPSLTLTPASEVGQPGSLRLLLALRTGDTASGVRGKPRPHLHVSLVLTRPLGAMECVSGPVSPETRARHPAASPTTCARRPCTEVLVLGQGLPSASPQLAPGRGLPGRWTRASQPAPPDRPDQGRRGTPVCSRV